MSCSFRALRPGFLATLALCLPWDETGAETGTFEGVLYHTHLVDPARESLRLFWRDDAGLPYRTFRSLNAALEKQGQRLAFAINAGIYEPGYVPTGLHVEEGNVGVPLNRQRPGPPAPGAFTPNFYLLPNGVFYLLPSPEARPGILETEAYAAAVPALAPRLAVQSGPLLLSGGRIHPAFRAESTSRLIRNGVGIDGSGKIRFVATDRSDLGRINLHGFARLFRALDCADALYLDGDISEFYLRGDGPEIQATTAFAAIFAVTEPLPTP